jgi:predicted DNA-binding protein
MTDREAMQQALEALEEINKLSIGENAICLPAEIDEAMDALRERLAQPEQEPVAYTLNCVCGAVWDIKADGSEEMAHTPDTTPPQRQWQGLARLELQKAVEGLEDLEDCWIAIESALREKNT